MSTVNWDNLPLEERVELLLRGFKKLGLSIEEYYTWKNKTLEELDTRIDELVFEKQRWEEDESEYWRIDSEIQKLQALQEQLLNTG